MPQATITVHHVARSKVTLYILTQVLTAADAARSLDRLIADSAELQAAAIFDAAGKPLAISTGVDSSWESAAQGLWAEADKGAGPVATIHVGGPDGEVFGLRYGDLSVVGVSGRYSLGSLILMDMKMALHDLAAGNAGMNRAASTDTPDPVA